MVVGEKTRFWIPADLAYGETPARVVAPAGMLVFDSSLRTSSAAFPPVARIADNIIDTMPNPTLPRSICHLFIIVAAHACSATDPPDVGKEASTDGPSGPTRDAANADEGEAGASQATCSTPADCRTFSNYCDGCTCDVLGTAAADPTCPGRVVNCLIDPCADKQPSCGADHRCELGDP
jgi:hypothetical protein